MSEKHTSSLCCDVYFSTKNKNIFKWRPNPKALRNVMQLEPLKKQQLCVIIHTSQVCPPVIIKLLLAQVFKHVREIYI